MFKKVLLFNTLITLLFNTTIIEPCNNSCSYINRLNSNFCRTEEGYSSVEYDLNGMGIDISNYYITHTFDENMIEFITFVEADKGLYLYLYRTTEDVMFKSVNISTSNIECDGYYDDIFSNYKISLISYDSYGLCKYKIDELNYDDFYVGVGDIRRYAISNINYDYGNVSHSLNVSEEYNYSFDEKFNRVYSNRKIKTCEIKNKLVANVFDKVNSYITDGYTRLLMNYNQLSYTFFDIDFDVDSIIECRVKYNIVNFTAKKGHSIIPAWTSNDSLVSNYGYLDSFDINDSRIIKDSIVYQDEKIVDIKDGKYEIKYDGYKYIFGCFNYKKFDKSYFGIKETKDNTDISKFVEKYNITQKYSLLFAYDSVQFIDHAGLNDYNLYTYRYDVFDEQIIQFKYIADGKTYTIGCIDKEDSSKFGGIINDNETLEDFIDWFKNQLLPFINNNWKIILIVSCVIILLPLVLTLLERIIKIIEKIL